MIAKFIRDRAEHLSFNSMVASENIGAIKDKMVKRLSLHGLLYYSPLCPAFLNLFNNTSELNCFKSIMVRDGALGIHRFFFENPLPNKCRTKFLIHFSLSKMVPSPWIEQVEFYDHFYNIPSEKKEKEKLLLIVTIDKNHSLLEDVASFCKSIESMPTTPKKVECLILDSDNRDNEEENLTGHSFNFIRSLSDALSSLGISDVSFVNWSTVENIPGLNEYVFYDFNKYNYLYADSYILHFLLTRGASPLLPMTPRKEKKENVLYLSKNHGVQVLSDHRPTWAMQHKKIEPFLDIAYKKILAPSELFVDASEKNPPFCSKSFEDLTSYIMKTQLDDLI